MHKAAVLSEEELKKINSTSLKILNEVGIGFHYDYALDLFKKAGFKVDNGKVFFTEEQVDEYVSKAPSFFTVKAMNPEKNIPIGRGYISFAPGYGSPFIVEEGCNRQATLSDFRNFAILTGSSPHIDFSGGILLDMKDVPADIKHKVGILELLRHSDKPFMGSSDGARGAKDSIKMAEIVFGEDFVANKPVMVNLINANSPLAYSKTSLESMIEYSKVSQPLIISSITMAGATAPATLAGALALQNAEVLAGIVFSQLINPGNPVIYGGASAVTDMQDGELSVGGGETVLFATASAQLAREYNLPVRGGGGSVTDAKIHDNQSSQESGMTLLGTVAADTDFILHAAGSLQFYNAMSYEKFIFDEDLCGTMKYIKKGLNIDEEKLAFDVIKEVGCCGEFLSNIHTFNHFREEFHFPKVSDRHTYSKWVDMGSNESLEVAKRMLKERLEENRNKNYLDSTTEKQLMKYAGLDEKDNLTAS
ncbi:trimethylamine methyltransferase family protein [Natranaerofaba carboxydovora]|uniref:trimethylamine methyltransferase family protein n=1 Tax=Natranaerofaba carboxydovora TaxID=2742683 RepID=UPI001F12DE61|nr:trimethylamine methyltransferase family protein [Natranaerofaba carboxydovora]UMZ75471.1 Trimethylamine methyltransferase (MTTB) [Natranaerofaba carboxydovora]